MRNNQNGFSAIEALLVSIAVGVMGFVGWYVYQARKTQVPPATTKQNSNTTTVKPTPKVSNLSVYENKDIGFKFSYPKEWGEVEKQNNFGGKVLFTGSFTKTDLAWFSVAGKDYVTPESMGDPDCGEPILFSSYKPFDKGQFGASTIELLSTSASSVIYAERLGYCGGNYLYGRAKINLPKTNGLALGYGVNGQSYFAEHDSLDPSTDNVPSLSETEKTQFIDVVKTVSAL